MFATQFAHIVSISFKIDYRNQCFTNFACVSFKSVEKLVDRLQTFDNFHTTQNDDYSKRNFLIGAAKNKKIMCYLIDFTHRLNDGV